MAKTPTIEVQGVSVPAFMYGTAWKEERTEALTVQALAAGFRAIDTANQRKHYYEEGVGAALEAALGLGAVTRDEIFLQTKFTYPRGQDRRLPYDGAADPATQVAQSLRCSLAHLRVERLDAYVLHGPDGRRQLSPMDWTVWRAMEAAHDDGTTRLLGISNVALWHLEELWEGARVKPAFVQNRCYARTGWDREVRAFCRERGIVYQGFSLLTANERELRQPAVRSIAERLDATVAQVVFKFAMDVGMLPLTGTTSDAHMREDLACVDLTLTADDIGTIEAIGL